MKKKGISINKILLSLVFISFYASVFSATNDKSEDLNICPGWRYKCITITTYILGKPVTLPYKTKGKDQPLIKIEK